MCFALSFFLLKSYLMIFFAAFSQNYIKRSFLIFSLVPVEAVTTIPKVVCITVSLINRRSSQMLDQLPYFFCSVYFH